MLVQLHEAFELVFQLAALLVFVGVDAFDAFAELGDILPEGLQQDVQRLLVGLFELPGLFAEDLRGEVLELKAEALLEFLALGMFRFAFFGVFLPQGGELCGARGSQGCQFGLCAQMLFAQGAQFVLRLVATLARLRLEGFGGREALPGVGKGLVGELFFALQTGRFAALMVEEGSEARTEQAEHDEEQDQGIHVYKGRIFCGILLSLYKNETIPCSVP